MAKTVHWNDTARTAGGRNPGLDLDMLATQALAFLATGDPGRLQRFFALTGLDPVRLREAAGEPGFATAVVTYLCADEALLIAFAEHVKHKPETIARLVRARAESEAWDGA